MQIIGDPIGAVDLGQSVDKPNTKYKLCRV